LIIPLQQPNIAEMPILITTQRPKLITMMQGHATVTGSRPPSRFRQPTSTIVVHRVTLFCRLKSFPIGRIRRLIILSDCRIGFRLGRNLDRTTHQTMLDVAVRLTE
jgi:hypothetical protein